MSLAEETEAGPSPAARLLELIDETLPGEEFRPLRTFTQAYLRRLSGEATGGISAEDLLAEVRGAFEFASARGDEPVAVRVFNPTREEHGYEPAGSVVETNTDDWPFLVDSVSGELEHRGLEIARLLHPVVGIERDEQGRISSVGRAREAPHRESIMHFDLGRRLDADELADVEQCVRSVLQAVRGVVADFPAMTERVDDMVTVARAGTTRYPRDEAHEVADFLEWLLQGNFVLLGAREYDFSDGAIRVVPGSGLGILRDEEKSAFAQPVPLRELPPAVLERAMSGDLLLVDKTNALSPVHRHERMDYVGVRSVSRSGEIVGEARLLGLFTSKAYAERASETPMLHRKLRQVLDAEDLIEGSHDYKAAVTLFDSFPKEELFAAPMEDLREAVVALTGLEGSDRVRVLAATGGRRAQRGGDRRAAAVALQPRPRVAADRAPAPALRDLGRGRPSRARRGSAGAGALLHVLGRRPGRGAGRGARGGGPRARAHVGRRAGGRSRARAGAGSRVGAALPGALQGLYDARGRGDRRRQPHPPLGRRAVRRRPALARHGALDPRGALQARRQDRALARDADARGPRAARDRGDLHSSARRR